MTVIGIYDFKLLELPGPPMIGVYLFETGQYLGTIKKNFYETGWTVAPGGELEGHVFLDEEKAADALWLACEAATAQNTAIYDEED